jgi:serine protease Do
MDFAWAPALKRGRTPVAVTAELGGAIGRIAEQVGPSVVGLGRSARPGSGVVVGDGKVLTAVGAPDRDGVEIILPGGGRKIGHQVAAEPDLGLALVEVETGGVPAVAPIPEGHPEPNLGTPVFALADPGGRGLRATLGFVASAGRSFRGPRRRRVAGAIEHTAPLPRGSSGGPLVDEEGRLLGLNLLRREGGLILAVPARARELDRLERIGRGEVAASPRLGVALAPPRVAHRLRRAVGLSEREGLLVRGVEPGSPAEDAGLTRGDLLVGASGRDLGSVDDLVAELDRLAGEPLELAVVRGEEELEVVARFDAGAQGSSGLAGPPAGPRRLGSAQ